jgi:hypothetical protein
MRADESAYRSARSARRSTASTPRAHSPDMSHAVTTAEGTAVARSSTATGCALHSSRRLRVTCTGLDMMGAVAGGEAFHFRAFGERPATRVLSFAAHASWPG